MTLIKSISGIRGTIGGVEDKSLTPIDVVKYTTAFADVIASGDNKKIVVGRDARISGFMINQLVCATLVSKGVDVVDLDLSTTPTVEMAVVNEHAAGGIILTASHNPKQWNALKLLNAKGEFISAELGEDIINRVKTSAFSYNEIDHIGSYSLKEGYIDWHIDEILKLDMVDVEAIRKRNFTVAVDAVNSTGGIAVPALLKKIGVNNVIELYCDPTGHFPHNPEPLPEHLTDLSDAVKKNDADLGIIVDPDVDRLAFVNEDGEMFGEEYTLVAVADYVLSQKKGNTVSNLSSTRALRDVTEKHGNSYSASAVGEVNVVKMMKETDAVIGGEGNGGIILPELHYGRDSLVGIALFLSHLAKSRKPMSHLKASYPSYIISKNKIELTPEIDVDFILEKVQEKYKNHPVNTIDGVKIEFDKEWVHLRKSNTEPIIRIYAEGSTMSVANSLANKIKSDIKELLA
ncbi:MAG: phosphoglucosamine mutase [Bacteroidetes bacterium]|jgi:phosphomannomutase|nr:phosphoglucosamine mutase [Bacteroidota bacterium]MDA8930547.1 phosphoglucosamine mutase [Bacteroidia bacterium]